MASKAEEKKQKALMNELAAAVAEQEQAKKEEDNVEDASNGSTKFEVPEINWDLTPIPGQPRAIVNRVIAGQLPHPQEFFVYYVVENHTQTETIKHFNISFKTYRTYIDRFNIKKGSELKGTPTSELVKEVKKEIGENPQPVFVPHEADTKPTLENIMMMNQMIEAQKIATENADAEKPAVTIPEALKTPDMGLNSAENFIEEPVVDKPSTPEKTSETETEVAAVHVEEKTENATTTNDSELTEGEKTLATLTDQQLALINLQRNRYQEIVNTGLGYVEAMFRWCFEFNVFYSEEVVNQILESKTGFKKLPDAYIKAIESDKKLKGRTFYSQIKRKNFEKLYSCDMKLLLLNEDDKKNRQQVISIIGYDPFEDASPEDKPQLYRDLTDLVNEDMRKDAAKKKAAIEIARNYLNISRYQKRADDLIMSGETDADTQKQIDAYLSMVTKIQTSINQTTKENGFSGGRAIGANGRGGLSEVMNTIEASGYDKGVTNYYDIETSKAIQEVATISFNSLLAQVKLSKADYADILCNQAKLVKKAQEKAMEAMEALRLAKEKLVKQQLLIELEKDYRRKGIKEDEIKEFIESEYDLYDGTEM